MIFFLFVSHNFSKNITLAIISIAKLGIKYLVSGVLTKETKNMLLSAISKKINIKAVFFLKVFFIIISIRNEIVTNIKIMFESIPRAIKKIKKTAELKFIDPRSLLGITLFKSLSTNFGIWAS